MIGMLDTYNNRHIEEPRNVPFIDKDGLPGGTFVVTVVEIGADGAFLSD
jgi:hypothetical protein